MLQATSCKLQATSYKLRAASCELRATSDELRAASCAGDTPLHDAARFGHVEIVRLLLDSGANCSEVNFKGQTALDLAILHGKAECTAMLTKHQRAELAAAARGRRESFMMAGAAAPLAKR